MALTKFKVNISLQFDSGWPVTDSVPGIVTVDRWIGAASTFQHLVVHCRDLEVDDLTCFRLPPCLPVFDTPQMDLCVVLIPSISCANFQGGFEGKLLLTC
jgi:hypothetical protein